VHEHGGSISGNAEGGAFSVPVPVFGKVKGTFAVSGQTCTIHITSKSMFLPCSTIEKFVKDNIPTVEEKSITEM
jgi:hypothetical protein